MKNLAAKSLLDYAGRMLAHDWNESDHDRDEGGKFTSGGGGSGGEQPKQRPPHNKKAQIKQLLEAPNGMPYMKDTDGNLWQYSQRREAWIPSKKDPDSFKTSDNPKEYLKEVTGGQVRSKDVWADNSKIMQDPVKHTRQTDPVGVKRALQTQMRLKRVIPIGPRTKG